MESGLRGVGTETRSRRGGHGEWIERVGTETGSRRGTHVEWNEKG